VISKSLSQAIKDAEKEMPAGGSAAWEDNEYTVTVVAANVSSNFGYQQIGMQLQNEDTGSRRWFNLSFDDSDPKWIAITGRKLEALGLISTLDALGEQFPVLETNTEEQNQAAFTAQLDGLATALVGIKFVALVEKQEKNKTKKDADLRADQREYVNFLKEVKRVIDGPVSAPAATPPVSGLGGLNGLMG
jgi:hypothetical protein